MTETWRTRLIRTLLLIASSASAKAFAEPAAAAPTSIGKSACISEYVTAQQDRLDGHLQSARAHLEICAQAACPSALSVDCRQWLNEVDALLPSVRFVARSPDGKDVPRAQLFVDEHLQTNGLGARALSLDPGDHAVRLEAPGFIPVRESLFVQQGERNRNVTLALWPTSAAEHRERHTSTYLLGAAGIGTTAIGVILLASGIGEAKHLQTSCKPTCSEDDVSSARAKIVAGNVGVGLGVVAIAGALWIYLAHSPSTVQAASGGNPLRRAFDFELNVGPRGSWAGLVVPL